MEFFQKYFEKIPATDTENLKTSSRRRRQREKN